MSAILNPPSQLGFNSWEIVLFGIRVVPPDDLSFDYTAPTGPLTRGITKVLSVTNPHQFSIAFKVKTTAPKVHYSLSSRSRLCLITSAFLVVFHFSCMSSGQTLGASTPERVLKLPVCTILPCQISNLLFLLNIMGALLWNNYLHTYLKWSCKQWKMTLQRVQSARINS